MAQEVARVTIHPLLADFTSLMMLLELALNVYHGLLVPPLIAVRFVMT
jgi:hypothetical protein